MRNLVLTPQPGDLVRIPEPYDRQLSPFGLVLSIEQYGIASIAPFTIDFNDATADIQDSISLSSESITVVFAECVIDHYAEQGFDTDLTCIDELIAIVHEGLAQFLPSSQSIHF